MIIDMNGIFLSQFQPPAGRADKPARESMEVCLMQNEMEQSAWACRNWKSLDFLRELRLRIEKLAEAKHRTEVAYQDVAEWLTEADNERSKFSTIRELFTLHGLSDSDLWAALEKRFDLKRK